MSEPVIIALSGKKGSGKNTVAKYISIYFYKNYGMLHGVGVKEYAFADLLKEFCIDVLGLEKSQCYGSDDKKNTLTKYPWCMTPRYLKKHGLMTGRDVMQIFGTESVRQWFGNVWAEATVRRIRKENPRLAIITDNRFVNEADLVLEQPNAYLIRLTRSPFAEDEHASETSLDGYNWDRERCFVLDNADISIEEQNHRINPLLGQIFSECNL